MNAELGDPLGVLSEDQAEIEAAFRAVESPSGDPVELRDKIVRRLECHGLLEREIVYPRLVEAAPDQAEMVRQARRSEKRISELVGVIEGKPLQLPETASALHQLMAEARQHIERERSEVLPALRNVLSEGQL
ncbi:MAG: hemerythrin domain-containing protein, partial [Acidimicrobiales bacterium]